MPITRSESAKKAWATRRRPQFIAAKNERASKAAFSHWCGQNGWKVIFFEGRSGAPRTGIVDAVIVRIRPSRPDQIDLRLVQLKSGAGGLTAAEMKRLKAAWSSLTTGWIYAAYDGSDLHFLPNPHGGTHAGNA